MITKKFSPILFVALCCLLPAGFFCKAPIQNDGTGQETKGWQADETLLARARDINRRTILLDSHVDIPWDFATEKLDPGTRNDKLQVDLVKMREGGLDGVFFIGWARQGPLTDEDYNQARQQVMHSFEAIHRLCEQMYPESIELAYSPDDILRIAAEGKLVAVIGLENGYPLGRDISMVRTYHDLGVRYITLCHAGHNQICDSANPLMKVRPEDVKLDQPGEKILSWTYGLDFYSSNPPEPEHGGLSELGRQLVAEMNRLGIMVDVSHLATSSVLEAITVSKAPVIASHSCCKALCDISRNLDDRCIEAIKKNGGCVQITAVPGFVKFPRQQREAIRKLIESLGVKEMGYRGLAELYKKDRPAYDKLIERSQAGFENIQQRFPEPDVADLADHIEHVVKLAGIDHVGIGSDFGGGGGVRGFRNAADAVNITAELLRRGYSEEDIAKIWSGNLLRVWREAGRVGAGLRTAG
jgi:membrane dipeptidase